MEFIYRPGSLSKFLGTDGIGNATVLVDFFDTIAVRNCSPTAVFLKTNWILTPFRILIEQVIYRFISKTPTIEEIVRYLPFWSAQKEINKEIESLTLNKELIDELIELQSKGAQIHVVSDTYFSEAQLKEILDMLGSFTPDYISTSSSQHLSKKEGLYGVVKFEALSSNRLTLVVGDDLYADGMMAIESGINFAWVITEQEAGLINFNVDPSHLAVKSLGNLLSSFLNWIESEVRLMEADKILFLSRDTHILKRIWDKSILSSVQTIYLPASRKVAIESGFLEANNYSVGYIGQSKKKSFSISNNGSRNFIDFYKDYIGSSQKIAIIDLGWNGSFQNALQEAFPNKEFVGLYLGVLTHNSHDPRKKGFLFDTQKRYKEYEDIVKDNIDILEVLLSSPEGTLLSVSPKIEREVIDSRSRAINLVSTRFADTLVTEIPWLENSDKALITTLERLEFLGSQSPEWFIKAMSLVKHKVSPYDVIGQSLFFSSLSNLKSMNRIWWKPGSRRYGRYLMRRNYLHYLVFAIGTFSVQIKFLIRAISSPSNLKKILKRLGRILYPQKPSF